MRPLIEACESRAYLTAVANAETVPYDGTSEMAVVAAPLKASADDTAAALRRQLLARLGDPTLAASLGRTLRYSGPDAFDASLLKYMTRRDGPVMPFTGKRFTQELPDDPNLAAMNNLAQYVARADAVLAHRFPEQLSATAYNVQLPAGTIDWLTQPKTTTNPNFVDSLNHQQFWKDLAIASRVTGDGKYTRELVAELQSWAAQNPEPADPDAWAAAGPAWNLLAAADRAQNWVYAYALVLGTADWTPAANTLFLANLWEHGDFLSRVTTSGYNKNRTALQGAAAWELGILFPEFADAPVWQARGADVTFRCLGTQFFPDGGHVEQTPFYALSVLDSMLQNFRLAQQNSVPGWTRARRQLLVRCVEAVYEMLGNDGRLPGVSDTYRSSGVGRFFTRAALTLGDPRYYFRPAGEAAIEDVIAAGGNVDRAFAGQQGQLSDRPQTVALPDAGYFVLRGESGRGGVVFDAGPKGGAHGHYDLLNFEIDGGYNTVSDPGPYTYDDSPQRQYVISTPAHNTISIDSLNHDAVEGAHNSKIVVDAFTQGAGEARVTAHHHAYQSLPGRPVVGRTIRVDQTHNVMPVTIVVDWGRSDAATPHTFTSSLNLHSATVTQVAPGVYDMVSTRLIKSRIQTLLLPGQTTALTDVQITTAPPPGGQVAAKRYAVSQTGTSYLSVTLVSDYVSGGESPTQPASIALEALPKKGQPLRITLTYPDGTIKHLEFAAPDLTPLAPPAAAAERVAAAPRATTTAPFSTRPVAGAAAATATDLLRPGAARPVFA